jgi:hypothetical protein
MIRFWENICLRSETKKRKKEIRFGNQWKWVCLNERMKWGNEVACWEASQTHYGTCQLSSTTRSLSLPQSKKRNLPIHSRFPTTAALNTLIFDFTEQWLSFVSQSFPFEVLFFEWQPNDDVKMSQQFRNKYQFKMKCPIFCVLLMCRTHHSWLFRLSKLIFDPLIVRSLFTLLPFSFFSILNQILFFNPFSACFLRWNLLPFLRCQHQPSLRRKVSFLYWYCSSYIIAGFRCYSRKLRTFTDTTSWISTTSSKFRNVESK